MNLLIVDDEREIREMLARHFSFLGHAVRTAENGREAFDLMSQAKTDIVISDIRMPELDGAELCRRIRRDYPTTRVIVITGQVTLDNAMTCLRQGADACLFKPIEDLGELEEAVERSAATITRWKAVLAKLASGKRE